MEKKNNEKITINEMKEKNEKKRKKNENGSKMSILM